MRHSNKQCHEISHLHFDGIYRIKGAKYFKMLSSIFTFVYIKFQNSIQRNMLYIIADKIKSC